MLKLLKWTAIGAVGLGGASYLLFGAGAIDYLSTAAASVRDSVRGSIPIDFELKRAEKLIQDIAPQIQQCKLDVARAEVQLDSLEESVQQLERDVSRAQNKLKDGAQILTSHNGEARYELAGGSYTRERVEIDLERTFETYKSNLTLLSSKRSLIERQTKAVTAARAKLDAVRSEEVRLKDLIGALKTQKVQLDAMAATAHGIVLDDSALGQAKKVLLEVKERLDVAQKMLADDLSFQDGPQGERRPLRNIVKEIQDHFAGQQDHGSELVEVGSQPGEERR